MTKIRGALGAIALVAIAAATPGAARAQQATTATAPAQPDTIWACYVPTSGTMYRIKVADTKDDCVGNAIAFSWNAKGIKGDKGDKGDTGPQGPPGTGGSGGFTLPYFGSANSTQTAFGIANTDGGGAGFFTSGGAGSTLIANYTGTSNANAIGATSSGSVAAVRATNNGTGPALRAEQVNTSSNTTALNVQNNGAGLGQFIGTVAGAGLSINAGGNGINLTSAGSFGMMATLNNPNGNSAIWATSNGRFSTADFRATGTSSGSTALYAESQASNAGGFRTFSSDPNAQAVFITNEGAGAGLNVTSKGASTTMSARNGGTGSAGHFGSANQYNTVYVENTGTGSAIFAKNNADAGTISAQNTSPNGGAGNFSSAGQWATVSANNSSTTNGIALYAEGHGTGHAVTFRNLGTGGALNLESSTTTASTLNINHTGGGGGVGALWATSSAQNTAWFVNTGTGNNIALGARGSGTWPVAQFEHTAGTGSVALRTFGDADINGNITIHGNQQVMGAKSAIIATDVGMRKVYSEESTEVWLSEYGEARLVDGVATVPIEALFAQTLDLDAKYHVFVQANDDATLYVAKRTAQGFEVRVRDGAKDASFSYRLVAKRKGFDGVRLAPADRN